MVVNRTALWVASIAAVAAILIALVFQLPAILHGSTVTTTSETTDQKINSVSLDPTICGNQGTAYITTVMQQCKLVCPVMNAADYQPNQVCSYVWTHADNAVTLTYPDGHSVTLFPAPSR
jgi:hypothetical protein